MAAVESGCNVVSKKKAKDQKKRSHEEYSGITAHKRQKKVLVPPLMAIPGVKLQSWASDRLPEMLWCGLLISRLGRERALEAFRQAAAVIPKLPPEKRTVQPTLSGLAAVELNIVGEFLRAICADAEAKSALRPLLLFDDLPAKELWSAAIGELPTSADWDSLKAAVLPLLNHQSQEATDCRWLRVCFF